MTTSINAESHKDPAQLEREVDQSRAHMSETLSALEEKLSPTHLMDQVLTYARQNSGEFSQNLVDTVKRNPVPTLLTAVGLGWLIYGQQHPSRPSVSYGTGYTGTHNATTTTGTHTSLTDRGQHVKDELGKSAAGVKAHMGQSADQLKHQAQHAADSLRHQSERAKASFTHMLEQQPLALGALGIALGALIGGALPPSRQEDKLMGKARDKVASQTKTTAKDVYDKTRDFGHEVAEDTKRSFHHQSQQSPYGPQ